MTSAIIFNGAGKFPTVSSSLPGWGNQNNDSEIDHAVNQQRHCRIAGQRSDTDLKRHTVAVRGVANNGPTAQIANGRQQRSRHFTNRRTEAVYAAADFRQRHNSRTGSPTAAVIQESQ